MVRPRLLFLGHTLPYPPDRGIALRSYHVLRQLDRRYEVDGLFFRQRAEPTQMPLEARVSHLEEVARVELFRIAADWSDGRHRKDQARSLVLRQSEARWRYGHPVYQRRVLERVFERDPRLVHVDGMALHGHLPLLVGRRVVLAHHRLESRELRLRSKLAGGLEALYLKWQARWMEEAEREWLPRVSANIVSFESDRDHLLALAPGARIEVIPPAVDIRHFSPPGGTGHGLAFVGGATAPASRDALEFFAGDILPRLRAIGGVQLLEPISWVGSAREGDRERYRKQGIDITGYVEDIRPIVRPAACFISPRRAPGAGMRILQAWSMGKAVVSTSMGCSGLEAVDGENILIRDDAASFARAVLDVLEDRELRHRLGVGGRSTAERSYSWEQVGQRLVGLYDELEGSAVLEAAGAGEAPARPGYESVGGST